MDYKDLVNDLNAILTHYKKVPYGDMVGAEGVYAHSGPMVYEDPEPYFIEQAITAITDLLACVETAEARCKKVASERDAATSDLKKWKICGTYKNYIPNSKKSNCKVRKSKFLDANWAGCSKWKWREQKEGRTWSD